MSGKVLSYQSKKSEKSATRPIYHAPQAGSSGAVVRQWDHPKSLMNCSFAALWPTNLLVPL